MNELTLMVLRKLNNYLSGMITFEEVAAFFAALRICGKITDAEFRMLAKMIADHEKEGVVTA